MANISVSSLEHFDLINTGKAAIQLDEIFSGFHDDFYNPAYLSSHVIHTSSTPADIINTGLSSWWFITAVQPIITQQIWDIEPMLAWCWTSVTDGGATLNQHWLDASCLHGSFPADL